MSALTLRSIACIAMLLDHIGYCWNISFLRIIGRIAFPIYVYLIYNGFCHTSNKLRYALRLCVFALLSQVPFSLFCYNQVLSVNGNVFFTLLAALLCLWSVDAMRKHKVLCRLYLLPSLVVCAIYHIGWIQSDYGAVGILMVLVFYFCDHQGTRWKVLTCIGLLAAVFYAYGIACVQQLILLLVGGNAMLPILSSWKAQQVFSAASLLLIFAYNGENGDLPTGRASKMVQYGFYLFYPVHLMILWLLKTL